MELSSSSRAINAECTDISIYRPGKLPTFMVTPNQMETVNCYLTDIGVLLSFFFSTPNGLTLKSIASNRNGLNLLDPIIMMQNLSDAFYGKASFDRTSLIRSLSNHQFTEVEDIIVHLQEIQAELHLHDFMEEDKRLPDHFLHGLELAASISDYHKDLYQYIVHQSIHATMTCTPLDFISIITMARRWTHHFKGQYVSKLVHTPQLSPNSYGNLSTTTSSKSNTIIPTTTRTTSTHPPMVVSYPQSISPALPSDKAA
jgi:hypothetical protein